MEITKGLEKLCIEKFGFGEVEKIAESIIERMEECTEDEIEDELKYAMDLELIYTEDLWTIMAYYQTPQEANFNKAMEEFYNDLLDILYILYKVNA